MQVSQEALLRAGEETGVSEETIFQLWQALGGEPDAQSSPSFHAAHVAYYFGALIVAGAMGWFVSQAFDRLSGMALTTIAVMYALIALLAASYFWKRPDLRVLGGLCAVVAVCMTPLAIFGLEKAFHIWPAGDQGLYYDFHPYIRASWIYMEIGTVLAGLAALRFFAFPFLTAPIAYALWYMSMDATALLFNAPWTFHQRCYISIAFGVFMLLVSVVVDHRTRDDYAFWGYLFGMLALWGGLSLLNSGSQLAHFLYCCLNVVFVMASLILNRRVFLVFGAIGIFGYLANLAYTFFRDSMLFPFAVSVIGIATIALGVFLQRNMPRLEAVVQARLPENLVRYWQKRREFAR